MKNLQSILDGLEGYLISIQRNAEEGMYELEVGLPKNWVYKNTKKIEYETIHEGDNGSIIKVFGIEYDVVIDDLVDFVEVIIETNQRIAKMQEEFDEKMKRTKEELVSEQLHFIEKLDEVKETSFKSIDQQLKESKKKKENRRKANAVLDDDDSLEKEIGEKLSN